MESNSKPREILIIGSSIVHQLQWRRRTGFYIRLITVGGLTHENLINIAKENITDKTAILILVCFQVELHSRSKDRQGRAGMVYANPTPPIENIVRRVSSADHEWKAKGINTIWVAPYTPNLVRLNTVRKRARNWGYELTGYEVETAEHYMDVIEENRVKLIKTMESNHVEERSLKIQNSYLTEAAGSDGLHLSQYYKRELFGLIIDKSIKMHEAGPPIPREVGLPLTPELREAVTAVRRQKRKMQRTRAAERALFQAAREEEGSTSQKVLHK